MKNMYKKHCDIFVKSAKSKDIHFQRGNGSYYITDGFTVLTVPAALYDEFIRPLNVIFIPLQDGEKAIKRTNSTFTEIDRNACDIKHIFEIATTETPVQILPLILRGENKTDYQLAKIGGRALCFNAAYMAATAEYLCGEPFKAGGGRWPTIKAESTFGGCLVLPCNCKEKLSAVLGALQEVTA